jgi:hypothetical protein
MNMGRSVGEVKRFLLRPIGWPTHLLVAAVALVVLWDARLPGDFHFKSELQRWLGTVVGWWWAGRAIARYYGPTWWGVPRWMAQGHWRRWLVLIVVMLAVGAITSTSLPLRTGFWISRPAMERLANQVMSAPPGTPAPADRWVGVYHTAGVEQIPGGMRFLVAGNVFDWWGFAYSTIDPPADMGFNDYEHFDGRWYIWEGRLGRWRNPVLPAPQPGPGVSDPDP